MTIESLIDMHTTYAPRAGNLEPAAPTTTDRLNAARLARQERFDEAGLPRGLGAS